MKSLARIGQAVGRVWPFQMKQAVPGGGWMLPLGGGYIPGDWPTNWWQCGHDPLRGGGGAIVYACIAAYAQTTAMLPGTHWRTTGNGGRERVVNSALSRVLKRPNSYQSISDFFLNLTTSLYGDGNAYALALRNNRFEISELHLMDSRISAPRIAVDGSVYYNLAGNHVVDKTIPAEMLSAVPAREVLHVRLDTHRYSPSYPLLGEPPLTAAMLDVAASNNMVQQALAYSQNQARPSGVLMTDTIYTRDQLELIRARWNEWTVGAGAGGTPILTEGMKWAQTATTSRDAQLAEMLQITDGRVASVFRVPLELLSLFGAKTSIQGAAVEDLMRFWVASGLGFCLNHIEEAVGRTFQLAGLPDEYLELDTTALERSNMLNRVEALARGVQGGIYSPNEARALEALPAAKDGDEPRVQQQVIPLSFASNPPAPPAPPSPPPADPVPADAAKQFAASVLRHAA